MRVRELEDEAKRLQARVQAAEDRDKSELEKATGRAERLEKRLAEMTQQQARHEVAEAKEIPVVLLEGVSAGDRGALEQAADAIVDYAKGVAEQAVEAALAQNAQLRRRSTAESVARGAPVTEPLDMNELIRAGFRR